MNKQEKTHKYAQRRIRNYTCRNTREEAEAILLSTLMNDESVLIKYLEDQLSDGGFIEFDRKVFKLNTESVKQTFLWWLRREIADNSHWLLTEYQNNRPSPWAVLSQCFSENEEEFDSEELDKEVLSQYFIVENGKHWFDMSSRGLQLELDERDLLDFAKKFNKQYKGALMYLKEHQTETEAELTARRERTEEFMEKLEYGPLDLENWKNLIKDTLLEEISAGYDDALPDYFDRYEDTPIAKFLENMYLKVDEKDLYVAIISYLEKNFAECSYVNTSPMTGSCDYFHAVGLADPEVFITEKEQAQLDMSMIHDRYTETGGSRNSSGEKGTTFYKYNEDASVEFSIPIEGMAEIIRSLDPELYDEEFVKYTKEQQED